MNPLVFYAACFFLLAGDYYDWMAALARTEMTFRSPARRLLLLTLGTALAFLTLAIPVQPEITRLRVRRPIRVKGVMTPFEATVEPREADRVSERPASVWRVDLGDAVRGSACCSPSERTLFRGPIEWMPSKVRRCRSSRRPENLPGSKTTNPGGRRSISASITRAVSN